jgi:hypothetical protein
MGGLNPQSSIFVLDSLHRRGSVETRAGFYRWSLYGSIE